MDVYYTLYILNSHACHSREKNKIYLSKEQYITYLRDVVKKVLSLHEGINSPDAV